MGRGRGITVVAVAAAALTACSGGDETVGNPGASPTPAESAVASESVSSDPEPTPTVAPSEPGFAWQVDGAVLLTATDGTEVGRLEGWTLDLDASTRLAAAVVADPQGRELVATVDGWTGLDAIPLADGAVLAVLDDEAVVTAEDGTELARLGDPSTLWVSAVGDVVGVVDGEHVDVTLPGPFEAVEPGCRTADRHVRNAPLLVCDDGARIAGGTDVPAPDGMRWTWVTVGTTGEEFLATASGDDGATAAYVGTRDEGIGEPVVTVEDGGGRGIFHRSSGAAWLARYGDDGALLERTPAGNVSEIAAVPGATAVAIWLR